MGIKPSLSLVVLTYAEKRISDLKDLLASIEVQSVPDLEVVVVVERSEVLRSFMTAYDSKYPIRTHFAKERLGVSAARNVGVGLSSGKIIAFVDDDAILAPNWSVQVLRSFLSQPDVIGVTGRVVPLPRSVDLNGYPQSLYWAIGCTRSWEETPHYTSFAAGTNMAFRREAFDRHRFALNIIGNSISRTIVFRGLPNDENDFAVRLTTDIQKPIFFDPRVVVMHKVYPERLSLTFVRRYSFWQGVAEGRYHRNPKWRDTRTSVYRSFVPQVVRDYLTYRGGIRLTVQKDVILTIGLVFVVIGYLASRGFIGGGDP